MEHRPRAKPVTAKALPWNPGDAWAPEMFSSEQEAVLNPPEIPSGLNYPIILSCHNGTNSPCLETQETKPSLINNLIQSLQVQIAAYCMELKLPPPRTGQKAVRITEEPRARSVCVGPLKLCLQHREPNPASGKGSSCTQDDKIFLDLDPEVSPAMAASCSIFTVVVPCSFNGLS